MKRNSLIIFLLIAALGPIYGGCLNFFRRKKFVENENPCSLPPDRGTCNTAFLKYFYNSSSRNCKIFIYGGCGGNENNFWTEGQCMEACDERDNNRKESNSLFSLSLKSSPRAKDVCDHPKNVGICYASKKRYYFDGETCEQFIYGGCGGNPNNFRTREDCMNKCGHKLDIGSGEVEEENLLSVFIL